MTEAGAGGSTLPTPDDDGIDHAHTSFQPVEAAARAEIAEAIRDLGHALVGHHTPTDELNAVAAELRGLSARLSVGATRERAVERPTGDWGPAPASGDEMFSFDERPISGTASPYGLDMRIVRDGDEVVARLVGGRVVQHVPMMGFTVALGALQALALVILGLAEATWLMFATIVLFGATVGNILMLQPLLVAERFGVRDYARIFSRSQLISMAGVAGGPFLIGWLYDLAGSYRIPYVVAGGLSLTGAFVLSQGGPATVPDDE